MFAGLSDDSVYFRFFSPLPHVPHGMLRRLVDVDHCRHETLLGLRGTDVVAVAGYGAVTAGAGATVGAAEISLVVADAWHRRGIGTRLFREVAALAFGRGFATLVVTTLPTNRAALGLVTKIAPTAAVQFVDGLCEARLTVEDLARPGQPFVTPAVADRHYPDRAA
jgi:GNAT superfamily N-acetyltransferase